MSQFGSGIQAAPLQVYHAGLAFIPSDSILGQSFSSLRSSRWSVYLPSDDLRHEPSFRTFEGDGRPIGLVAFSAHGILATCTDDGTIRVWDPAPGKLLFQFEWAEEPVNAIALGAEGQLAASSRLQIRLWDLKTHKLLQTFDTGVPPDETPPWSVNSCMEFSEPEDFLCVVHDPTRASRYNWRNGRIVDSTNLPLVSNKSMLKPVVALSPNGRYFATDQDSIIQIFDWETPQGNCQSLVQSREYSRTLYMSFSHDCRVLAAATYEIITMWNLENGQAIYEVEILDLSFTSAMVFSRTELIIGKDNGSLIFWETETQGDPRLVLSHGDAVTSVACASTQGNIASGSADGTVKVWDQPAVSSMGQGTLTDPKRFAVGYNSGTLFSSHRRETTAWDVRTCTPIQHFECAVFAASEVVPRLAMFSFSEIKIYNTDEYSVEATIPVQLCHYICFSNDGTKILYFYPRSLIADHTTGGSYGITLFVHDVKTGQCEWTGSFGLLGSDLLFSSATLFVEGLRFRVALGANDGSVWVLENNTEAPIVFNVTDHTDGFSPSTLVYLHDANQLLALSTHSEGWVRETTDWSIMCKFPKTGKFSENPLHPSFFKNTVITASDCPPESRLSAFINHYHILPRGEWLMNGTEAVLWLPAKYRPYNSALLGSTLALATSTGQVWFLKYT